MKYTAPKLLLMIVFITFAEICVPEEVNSFGVTANLFSKLNILPMKLKNREFVTSSEEDIKFKNCVENISENILAPLFNSLFTQQMTSSEINYIDNFFKSKDGDKYSQYLLGETYKLRGLEATNNIKLTEKEAEYFVSMSKSDAGKKLLYITSDDNEDTKLAVTWAAAGILLKCKQ